MIGTPSGNLVSLFLHAQLALPSLTPLSQFTGSAFLAHQQAAAVLPFPCFFHGGCHDFLGGILADKVGHIKVMRISFLVMVPALFFLTNSTSQTTATLLLVPTALSLLRLTVPWSSWDRPTLPATLVCFRRDLGSQCQCRRPDFSPGRMGCRPLGCWS